MGISEHTAGIIGIGILRKKRDGFCDAIRYHKSSLGLAVNGAKLIGNEMIASLLETIDAQDISTLG